MQATDRAAEVIGIADGTELEPQNRAQQSWEIDRDVYSRERSNLVEMEIKGAEQYDKAMLTLSAGALALSLTFVDNLTNRAEVALKWLIGASWIGFSIAIICTLASFLLSQLACRRQRELLEELVNDPSPESSVGEFNWYSTITQWLNVGSLLAFIFGTIAMACFTWCNLPTSVEITDSLKSAIN